MIEKILNEISRLKKELDGYSALEALDYIESYINIISREPANEDLEKETDKEIDNLCELGCYMEDLAKGNSEGVYPLPDNVVKELRKFACHFTEWQKQQMMKDAVDGEYWDGSIYLDNRPTEYEDGNKVKIIIIKEE